ncbi:MAG: hypothetical protein OXH03_08830 [Bacteroidetes bacterium]|nr:hypothetical protein [Bacteroidota bacterium]
MAEPADNEVAVWMKNVNLEKTNDKRLLRSHAAETSFIEPRIQEAEQ